METGTWHRAFRDPTREHGFEPLRVEGTIPAGLQGVLYRVGMGRFSRQGVPYEHWFDGEFQRLLQIGQTSGELDTLLDRLGRRYARQANRMIDRLATLLEPAVILTLAVLVGLVVMAAILPLLRMQEVV